MLFDKVVLKRAALIYEPVLQNSSFGRGTGFPPSALREITRLNYLQEHDLDKCNCLARACGFSNQNFFLRGQEHV